MFLRVYHLSLSYNNIILYLTEKVNRYCKNLF
nr:MAG TPA: hypothetical protein [Caudoviricetes sp.]